MVAAPPRIPRRTVPVQRRGSHRHSRRWVWWLVLVVILVAGAGAGVLFSPVLRVRAMTVEGVTDEHQARIESVVWSRTGDSNLLFLDPDALSAALADEIPELQIRSVERVWPDEVHVSASERTSLGTWCRATEPGRPCYYFDRLGATWGEAIPSRGTLLMTVIDERPEGDLQADLLDDLLVLIDGLRALDVPIRQVTVRDGPLRIIAFETIAGYETRFSRIADIREQLEVFGAFISDRRATDTVPGVYMDMTIPGKVYYQ